MRFTQIRKSIAAQFNVPGGDKVRFLVLGAPGGGKTTAAREALAEIVTSEGKLLSPDRIVEMHPSHLDTCDFLGLPELSGEATRWVAPSVLHRIRKGTGPAALLLDEFTDSTMPVQNVLSALLLDGKVGDLHLTDELYVVCTGNRTEDKSGANRLSTKLGNRVRILTLDTNLDDWIEGFAIPNNMPVDMRQFLRYKPNLLHDFDPNRPSNPTPRSWAKVALVPTSLDAECYMANVAGEVSDGPAAEYIAFKQIYMNLPDLDMILRDPQKAPVPKDPAVQYAISGALANKADVKNFDAVLEYMERLPREFSVLCVKDAIVRDKKLRTSGAFTKWGKANAEVLL